MSPLECFINDKCIYLSLVNFSYRPVNYLSRCQRKVLFIIISRKCFAWIFVFTFPNYIIVNKLEINILLTKSQSYYIKWLTLLTLISIEISLWFFKSWSHLQSQVITIPHYIIKLQIGLWFFKKKKHFSFQAIIITSITGWSVGRSKIIIL